MTHVAIIGGGVSAVSVLAHLNLGENDVVTELSHHRLGPGRAYGETEKSALLNRPTYKMSMSNHEPNSFVLWLDRHYPNENREYVPRVIYGEYLKDYVQDIESTSPFRFSNIECDVKSLAKRGSKYVIGLQDVHNESISIEADQVVLALGSIVPGNPYNLADDKEYFSDVYPMLKWVNATATSHDVAVLGCGLSVFDAMLAAASASKNTHITLYSRREFTPDVRTPVFNMKPDPLLMASIEGCADMGIGTDQFYQMIEALCIKHGITLTRLMRAIDLLRRDPEQRFTNMYDAPVSVDPAVLGCVLDLAQNYITLAWALMDTICKEDFLTSYHTVFQSFANLFPPETDRAIGRLCRTGLLRFQSGIQDVLEMEIFGNFKCAGANETTNIVVNTTKATVGSLAPEADNLIRNMVKNGPVTENRFSGIVINSLTNRAISPNGCENDSIFAIGECTVGSLYYISAMTKIRNRAQSIACSLGAN